MSTASISRTPISSGAPYSTAVILIAIHIAAMPMSCSGLPMRSLLSYLQKTAESLKARHTILLSIDCSILHSMQDSSTFENGNRGLRSFACTHFGRGVICRYCTCRHTCRLYVLRANLYLYQLLRLGSF